MAEFVLSTQAYCKMALHCLKYPHFAVNGLLLAEKNKSSSQHHIVDSISLFHRNLQLTPMLEAALIQIDLICQKSNPQLQIVGYYQANERLNEINPDPTAFRICERVQANFPDAVLFMIDNSGFSIDCDRPLYRIYHMHEQRWKPKDRNRIAFEDEERTLATMSACIQTKLYRELVDFDNHLDDVQLDYLNESLNAKINLLV